MTATAKKLTDKGFKALGVHCDVSENEEVEALVKKTVETFRRLDVAYNNAGIQNQLAEAADQMLEDYYRVMGVNRMRPLFSCCCRTNRARNLAFA